MKIYQKTLVQGRLVNANMTVSNRSCYKTLKTCKIKPKHSHSLFQNGFTSQQYKGEKKITQ